MPFLEDLAGPVLQILFETAVDSVVSCKKGERRYGCGCFLVCCFLILLVFSLLVAANY